MDKVLIIINLILTVFIVIAIIKCFRQESKTEHSTTTEGESKEVIVSKLKKELNTHGLAVMYLCSVLIIYLLHFKSNLSTNLLTQSMYISGGVQSVFFLVKKDFTKVSLFLKVVCVSIISCVIGLLI
ncbi:hypothetical protein [Clostridium estertheticum]|uniref:hypothetical protein n=1 Tax=Clostridium estertheticum TaxID=238834 RepID=UPI001CF3DA68|nr:hypothetical protein [Clostridium estertheticum]MCB2353946.1 hypothetical protein [Clostridium estertheticum]WAG43087.1 hypothetical protein LL065_10565 [Clostridium estertheticum]